MNNIYFLISSYQALSVHWCWLLHTRTIISLSILLHFSAQGEARTPRWSSRHSWRFANFIQDIEIHISSGVNQGRKTPFQKFMQQHFMLVLIGSVVVGIIVLVLVISLILSLRMKKNNEEDKTPLTVLSQTKSSRNNEETSPLSQVEKKALSLILKANKD